MHVPPMAAPWRVKVLKSLARNKRLVNSRYVQLATVKPDGRPSNRTVVFRSAHGCTHGVVRVDAICSRSSSLQPAAHFVNAEWDWSA